jgi:hypothetical protein
VVGALGRIDGDVARDALVDFFPRARNQERVLAALFALSVEGARGEAARLALDERVSTRTLAEALGGYGFDDELDGTRPFDVPRDMTNDALLARVLAGSDGITTGNDGLGRTFLLRAVARFEQEAATAFLQSVAWGGGREATEALGLLAAGGDQQAIRACVDAELSRFGDEGGRVLHGFGVERLTRWPRATVREALLTRIGRGGLCAPWLFALRWFATSEDTALFERMEAEGDAAVADIAHEYLRGVGRDGLRRRRP